MKFDWKQITDFSDLGVVGLRRTLELLLLVGKLQTTNKKKLQPSQGLTILPNSIDSREPLSKREQSQKPSLDGSAMTSEKLMAVVSVKDEIPYHQNWCLFKDVPCYQKPTDDCFQCIQRWTLPPLQKDAVEAFLVTLSVLMKRLEEANRKLQEEIERKDKFGTSEFTLWGDY